MTAPFDAEAFLQIYADAMAGMQERIDDLTRQVNTAAPAAAAQPAAPVPQPRWWGYRATTADWTELRQWIDGLNTDGSLVEAHRIPDCWALHPGLVEDLAACHQAWRNAMIAQAAGIRDDTDAVQGGSVESSMWFTQGYWPMLDRLLGRYRSTECVGQHVPE